MDIPNDLQLITLKLHISNMVLFQVYISLYSMLCWLKVWIQRWLTIPLSEVIWDKESIYDTVKICLILSPSITCDYNSRKHLDKHQLLCDTQFGFREKRSIIDMLSYTTHFGGTMFLTPNKKSE